MKYMLLIYGDESRARAMTEEEIQQARAAVMPEWLALFEELEQRGNWIAGNELDMTSTAKTVRVRDDDALVTDGPYAETKEQLGGYFLVECENLDEAIELAAKVPLAKRGTIEVRPVVEH